MQFMENQNLGLLKIAKKKKRTYTYKHVPILKFNGNHVNLFIILNRKKLYKHI